MKEDKEQKYKKAGIRWAVVAAIAIAALVIFATFPRPEVKIDDGEWYVVWKGNLASAAENNPGAGVSGWLSTFQLDYAETPGTCMLNNATNGAYDGWGNVSGYVSADDAETDLDSENGAYFVIRARFNATVCGSGAILSGNRTRCYLTISGDETISNVMLYGSDTNIAGGGGGYISKNTSNYLWVNFVYDDGSNGYRITDDGGLDWNITLCAKY